MDPRPRKEHVFTAPNLLTLVRVPLAGAVWIAPGSGLWLAVVLAVAALTDVLDGRVARAIRQRRLERGEDPGVIGQAHATGAWLDPLCDKLFVLSVLGAVLYAFRPDWGVAALIATREVLIAPLILVYQASRRLRDWLRFDFRAGVLGKAATVAQFAAVAAIIWWPPGVLGLALGAAILGAAAAVAYVRRAVRTARYIARHGLVWERWLEMQQDLVLGRDPG